MFSFPNDLLIIDTETTGLEDYHVIVQWGSILLDARTLETRNPYSTRVIISNNDVALADPKAMEIHGIPVSTLQDPTHSIPFPQLVKELKAHYSGDYIITGSNVHYDFNKFLSMQFRYETEKLWSRITNRVWDAQSFIGFLSGIRSYGWGYCGLRKVCDRLNIQYEKKHSALDDCYLLAKVIQTISQMLQEGVTEVPKCDCSREMVLRTDKNGNKFWGCSGFSKDLCRLTKPYVT